ncbi:MAG: hypothetical protein DMF63_14620 [Acidobacteria bacterium]|nr:MAG: hypothetical protein DMF63_14620 [Acidobacteriota bacterium]
MKIILTVVMFVLCGVIANAQDAKVLAEIAASSEGTIKNAPFSAEAISESVQTLADGNRIVRSSSSKLYRNSEGQFRREMKSGSGGMLGSMYTYGQGVTLIDPVGGFRYSIDPNMKTTRQMIYRPQSEIRIVTGTNVVTTSPVEAPALSEKAQAEVQAVVAAGRGSGQNAVISEKVREEIKATVATRALVAPRALSGQLVSVGGEGMSYAFGTSNSNWEKRTENLGTQNIEGVEAEGTRTVTTIPADAIGNERPIEITYEKWFSKELQLVVMSKHNDPRFGEQTYRLTNIVRSEPDSSLFTVPNGYKVITEPSGAYTIATTPTKAVWVEKAAPATAAKPATAVTKTKP